MTDVTMSNAPQHGDWREVMIGDTVAHAVYLVE
jgi:hypothetical protein